MVQDFTDLPSSRTVQAPHVEVSHPTLVPVSPSLLPDEVHEQRPGLDVRLVRPCR